MSFRLASGGCDIDRTRPLTFTFDGFRIDAYEGDTIASALLAADIAIVGRSFKYHRPRGVWGAGVEEPNAYVEVEIEGERLTNVRATTAGARAGMVVRSINAWPSAAGDRKGALDRIARFLPAAFYYKTFMWPDWKYFQPAIRAMAGLGPRPEGADVSDEAWAGYLYMRRNPRGATSEIWHHLACGEFFAMTRDSVTHEVVDARPLAPGEERS